ncbi:FecR family protein [Mucilaginibacter lacusdianchii]|uniref:FecR family protein n=1 Tax=Mucilaginibacter lacusdianchii TaxID=2684211 RepID=UPI00131DB219|nr:FecR family protein [Mucilaginibacter sp. JXJ CY 39]
MDILKERLYYLLQKYFDNTATSSELEELYQLFKDGRYNDAIDSYLSDVWEKAQKPEPLFSAEQSERVFKHIFETHPTDTEKHTTKNNFSFWLFMAATLSAVLITVGYIYWKNLTPSIKEGVDKTKLAHDLLPGSDKATLTLSNGKVIVLNTSQQGVLLNQGGIAVRKEANGQLEYKFNGNLLKQQALVYNTLATPQGGQYRVVLSDGTKVWLNSASSIHFPSVFNASNRIVELTGEAYFEVAKNPSKPFSVIANQSEIKVFGTHFNVMAYSDEGVTKTTLLEGSVQVKKNAVEKLLTPGEQAVTDSQGKLIVKSNIDIEAETAWKDGFFKFDDTSISEVMRQISRWYNVNITYAGNIPTKNLTGTISRNVKASELLNMLSYTGVKFKIEGSNIIVLN